MYRAKLTKEFLSKVTNGKNLGVVHLRVELKEINRNRANIVIELVDKDGVPMVFLFDDFLTEGSMVDIEELKEAFKAQVSFV